MHNIIYCIKIKYYKYQKNNKKTLDTINNSVIKCK